MVRRLTSRCRPKGVRRDTQSGALSHEVTVVTKHGKDIAAVVPNQPNLISSGTDIEEATEARRLS